MIFDESSMIMLPAIVHALYQRKYIDSSEKKLTEFIVGGDPLQIPPVFDIDDEDLPEGTQDVKEENIYSMIGLKAFNVNEQKKIEKFGNKITNLDKQYRSIESIGTLFSNFLYEGKLSHGERKIWVARQLQYLYLKAFYH